MKKQGYKEMLRDRCPEVVNFALKWCKAKERWINHVYDCFVRIVGDEVSENGTVKSTKKDNKKQVTRVLLGLKKGKPRFFDFHKTIDWENLTDEEQFYWDWVDNWVEWFSVNYAYIENMYSISRKTGKYEEDSFIKEMSTKYFPDYDDDEGKRLAKFLISCIEGNTK